MFNTSTVLHNSPYKTADIIYHTNMYKHKYINMYMYISRDKDFCFFFKYTRRKVTPLLLSKNNFPGSITSKAVLNYSFNLIKTKNLSNTSEYDSE